MTTARQDREFNDMLHEHLRADTTLQRCIQWISDNVRPEVVFSEDELGSWAEEHGYAKKESEQ